jgi:hypothetical protein
MDDIEKYVRRLAKSSYYQSLFHFCKELHISLFDNKKDFTNLQLNFLNYLTFYNNLFTDIALGEISDKILEDDIYEDAYSYYKAQAYKKQMKDLNKERQVDYKYPQKYQENFQSQWVFKTPKRK